MSKLETIIIQLSHHFSKIGYVTIALMMALTVADVIGRYYSHPINGAIEIVSWLGLVTISSAISSTYILKGHTSVRFLILKLPYKAQAIIGIIVSIFSLVLFTVLTWRLIVLANELHSSGDVSWVLRWPNYPFVYLMALFCIPIIFLLLLDLYKYSKKACNR